VDPTQQKLMKRPDAAGEQQGTSPGALLAGAVVLVAAGIGLLGVAHAPVADVGGAMLVLIGLALGAGSAWTSARRA
jgi:hypothetical protein